MEIGSLMGYSAIFAGIAVTWGKIKMIFSHISSFVVETYVFDTPTSFEIFIDFINYKDSGFKKLSISKKSIFHIMEHIKPFNRQDKVLLLKSRYDNGVLYKRKGSFIIVKSNNSGSTNSDPQSSPGNSGGNKAGSVTFIRGTLNIKSLLKEASDYYYEVKNKEVNCVKKSSRFYVIHHRQPRLYQDNKNAVPSPPGRSLTFNLKVSTTDSGIKEIIKRNDSEIICFNSCDLGEDSELNKSFSHLAFPSYISGFIEEAERWHKSRDWFIENKIPWKRGWLLHGSPGNGKSSLARSLAEHLGIPLVIFDISTMDNDSFSTKWQESLSDHAPCIMLIEDIDAVFNGRKNLSGDDKLTFDCLLNNISGADKSEGAFLIVTTNNVDSIDAALGKPVKNGTEFQSTRPGRIDRVLELQNPNEACRLQIASRILKDVPHLIDETVKHGCGDSGAQFQERCAQIALKYFWEQKTGEQNEHISTT